MLFRSKEHLEKLLGRVARRQATTTNEEYAPKFPNISDDMDDNALEVDQYDVNLGEEKALEPRLLKVNAAFERIASGTYGKCSVGGEEIEEARLAAAPEADTCVKHAR